MNNMPNNVNNNYNSGAVGNDSGSAGENLRNIGASNNNSANNSKSNNNIMNIHRNGGYDGSSTVHHQGNHNYQNTNVRTSGLGSNAPGMNLLNDLSSLQDNGLEMDRGNNSQHQHQQYDNNGGKVNNNNNSRNEDPSDANIPQFLQNLGVMTG